MPRPIRICECPSEYVTADAEEGSADTARIRLLGPLGKLLQQNHLDLLRRLDRQDIVLAQLKAQQAGDRLSAANASPGPGLSPHDQGGCLSTPEETRSDAVSDAVSDAQRWVQKNRWKEKGKSQRTLFRSKSMNEELEMKAALSVKTNSDSSNVGAQHHPLRRCARFCVDHSVFEMMFGIVIATNAIWLGFETQYSVENPGRAPLEFHIVGGLYTFLFTFEFLLRFTAYGIRLFYHEGWLWSWLDVTVVSIAIVEVGLQITFSREDNDDSMDNLKSITSLRVVRIVRVTRLARMLKVLYIIKVVVALRTLVESIMHTMKSLVWALVLLLLIMYIFSIAFTQTVGLYLDDPASNEMSGQYRETLQYYWGSVGYSLLTLFMSIVGGLSWDIAIHPLFQISPLIAFVFLLYISFTYFAVLNVITGVFCGSAIEQAQADHELMVQNVELNKAAHMTKLRSLFKTFDEDERGFITWKEFEKGIKKESVKSYFSALGLDIASAWDFFRLLDEDQGSCVEIEEFLMGCMRLRGAATAVDVAKLMLDQHWAVEQQVTFMQFVEHEMKRFDTYLKYLCPELKDPLLDQSKENLRVSQA